MFKIVLIWFLSFPKYFQEIFHTLLGAFHSAHALILQEGGLLTTLCVAVAAQLKESTTWVLCVCNVGDSLCFVYSPETGVQEVRWKNSNYRLICSIIFISEILVFETPFMIHTFKDYNCFTRHMQYAWYAWCGWRFGTRWRHESSVAQSHMFDDIRRTR